MKSISSITSTEHENGFLTILLSSRKVLVLEDQFTSPCLWRLGAQVLVLEFKTLRKVLDNNTISCLGIDIIMDLWPILYTSNVHAKVTISYNYNVKAKSSINI